MSDMINDLQDASPVEPRREWVTPDFKEIELKSAKVGGSVGGSDGAGSSD